MGKFFMGLGVVLLLAGIGAFFVFPSPVGVTTDLPDAVFGANDTIAIDPDRLRAAVEAANERADTLNESGISYQTWAQRLLFLVFVAGSLIAFFAGLQKMYEDLKKKKVWLTVAIGLLGSLSAVSTYAAGYLDGQAKQSFGCISEIEKHVRKTVEDIRAESDAALADQYLGEMERKVARCPA
jgi:hypothetical protein